MSYNNLSFVFPASDKLTVKNAIQAIKNKMPFLANKLRTERKKIPKMEATRLNYIRDVYMVASGNRGALPLGCDLMGFAKNTILMKDMEDLLSTLLPLVEAIEDTRTALENKLVQQADDCYGHLKVAAQKDNSQLLGQLVKRISDQLRNHSKKMLILAN